MTRRRLDVELVRRKLVESRSAAQREIEAGRVLVGGAPALRAARRVGPDESVTHLAAQRRFVSRGGDKLAAALEHFGVDPTGLRALDAGASTGGFTHCLLEAGAISVVAVDVGYGQLAWELRTDDRVEVLERTNVRDLGPDVIGGPVPLIVADLSFISLRTVAEALLRCSTPDARFLLLAKPQFEAGRARVGKGGVIRDPEVRADVLVEVVDGLSRAGIHTVGAMSSPVPGADGNVEFVILADRHSGTVAADELRTVALADHARSEG